MHLRPPYTADPGLEPVRAHEIETRAAMKLEACQTALLQSQAEAAARAADAAAERIGS